MGRPCEVDPDSPAVKARIEPGWQILKFDAADIQTVRDYLAAFRKTKPGQPVKLTEPLAKPCFASGVFRSPYWSD